MMNLSLLTGIFVTGLAAAALAEAPAELVIVRTWGELRHQPEIELAEGLRVRLGIQSREQAANDGVLIYCLVNDVAKVEPPGGSDVLGPLAVKVRQVAVPLPMIAMVDELRVAQLAGGVGLYVYGMTLGSEGAVYEVTLLAGEDRPVARARVKASDEKSHPWLAFLPAPLDGPQEMRQVGPDDRADDLMVLQFGMPGHRAAPRWAGWEPLMVIEEAAPRDEQHLPTFLPAEVDAGLKLAVQGTVLQVSSDVPLPGKPFSEDYWLARWWVNGQPVAGTEHPELFARQNGIAAVSRHFDIEFTWDAAVIGAKTGDRIGVQLLHCMHGWRFAGDDLQMEMLMLWHVPGDPPSVPVRMSNRVEFLAP